MRLGGSVRSDRSISSLPTPTPPGGPGRPAGPAIFDEAPKTSVAFEPRTIRSSGQRGPLILVAWIVGLVTVAGLGFLDRLEAPAAGQITHRPSHPDQAGAARAETPAPAPAATSAPAAVAAHGVVTLLTPASAEMDGTTRQVMVQGVLRVRASQLRIAIETGGNRVLDQVFVDVTDLNGGIRPDRSPGFSANLDLPVPRSSDPLWVVVRAYDDLKLPLGATRRRLSIASRLESPSPLADSQPLSEAWRPPLVQSAAAEPTPMP